MYGYLKTRQGLHVYYMNKTFIGYLRIAKTGSESVKRNLALHSRHLNFTKGVKVQFETQREFISIKANLTNHFADTFSDVLKITNFSTATKFKNDNTTNLKVFTYIRDPILKLESGNILTSIVTYSSLY